MILINIRCQRVNNCVYNPLASPSRSEPQALFFSSEKRHASFRNDCLGNIVNMLCFYLFLKTPNRRGTHSYAEKLPNFVLSSHIDPIGDQNYVQYLSIY